MQRLCNGRVHAANSAADPRRHSVNKWMFATRPTVVCQCRFAFAAPAHHDQLVQAASDLRAALDLFELALTWNELDYSEEELIPPADWLEFSAEHVWPDAELAHRLFSAAVDVVRHGARSDVHALTG
jgi:beta-xylosidase